MNQHSLEMLAEATEALHNAELKSETARLQVDLKLGACSELPEMPAILNRLNYTDGELAGLQLKKDELKTILDGLEQQVINDARLIATTLTKAYLGRQLKDQSFDAIIIDEISMASPPLLFLAARLGVKRVILVGDFKQLPPIVRCENPICHQRLGTDAFHLAGVAVDLKATNHAVLVRLSKQRRMLPMIANVARRISYDGPNDLIDDVSLQQRPSPQWMEFLPDNPLVVVDTADLHSWSGRQAGSLSRFNFYSAQIAVELAAMAATSLPKPTENEMRPIGIVTPYSAQKRLILKLLKALELDDWVRAGTVHTFQGGEAELIIFDTVLDEPYWAARLTDPKSAHEVRRDLNVAVTRARSKFVLLGSSEWLNKRAKISSGLGQLWHYMIDHGRLVSANEFIEKGFANRVAQNQQNCYCIPRTHDRGVQEVLDEMTFFEKFEEDLGAAEDSIFGLVPFFGEYRWPKVEPHLRAALERGVKVTLLTPPSKEAENSEYVEQAIHGVRQLGAIVLASTGLHGKDIIIDERIHYTGSLNWASHRGRSEIMHRTESKEYSKLVLDYLQAKHINMANPNGKTPRTCPLCYGPLQVVNQTRPLKWEDKQPLKIGCANYQKTGCKYLVNIETRVPLVEPPICSIDNTTKYRRVKRGKGERWECPKHPKQCKSEKVIVGDV